MIGANLDEKWFFSYGFAKDERVTIECRELAALQRMAAELLSMESKLLNVRSKQGK